MEDDEGDEFGEDELSEDLLSDSDKGGDSDDDLESNASDPYGDEDDDSSDEEGKKKKKKKQNKPKELVIKEVPADPYLVRREATLLNLVLKHFK